MGKEIRRELHVEQSTQVSQLLKSETNVKEIIQRTHNVKSFRFEVPRDFSYMAGQFFFITVKDGTRELTKHFSFSSNARFIVTPSLSNDVGEIR